MGTEVIPTIPKMVEQLSAGWDTATLLSALDSHYVCPFPCITSSMAELYKWLFGISFIPSSSDMGFQYRTGVIQL